MMEIIRVEGNKKQYPDLLLLADEQESMIDRYLERGELFVGIENGEAAAVMVVTDEGGGVLEIKNLAVAPDRQGRGHGREMIEYAARVYAQHFTTLRVGTGESPLTLPFYKKCGFEMAGRIKDFFTNNYDHPIIEGGVLLRDMVILEKEIKRA